MSPGLDQLKLLTCIESFSTFLPGYNHSLLTWIDHTPSSMEATANLFTWTVQSIEISHQPKTESVRKYEYLAWKDLKPTISPDLAKPNQHA
jgi:hypothetical protein